MIGNQEVPARKATKPDREKAAGAGIRSERIARERVFPSADTLQRHLKSGHQDDNAINGTMLMPMTLRPSLFA